MELKDPGRAMIYLLYSWGSRFGVPSRVPLHKSSFSADGTSGRKLFWTKMEARAIFASSFYSFSIGYRQQTSD